MVHSGPSPSLRSFQYVNLMYTVLVYSNIACTMPGMATRHPRSYRRMLERLRRARQEAGLTQVEAAKALKASQQFVSRVELGERRIDPVELQAFARLYGKTVEYFIDASEEG